MLLSAEPAVQPRSAPKILGEVGFLLYDQVAAYRRAKCQLVSSKCKIRLLQFFLTIILESLEI